MPAPAPRRSRQPSAAAGADGSTPPATTLRDRESAAVLTVQEALGSPAVVRGAQALSSFGDHAAGWLALGVLGAAVDAPRRAAWVRASAAVLGAHAATVVVKRVLRRARPATATGDALPIVVHATTPGRLSFPSSHAASSTAAALAYGALLGGRRGALAGTAVVAPVMGASRLVLGLHFPTDVAVGTAVGVLAGRWARAGAAGGRRGGAR